MQSRKQGALKSTYAYEYVEDKSGPSPIGERRTLSMHHKQSIPNSQAEYYRIPTESSYLSKNERLVTDPYSQFRNGSNDNVRLLDTSENNKNGQRIRPFFANELTKTDVISRKP